MTNTIRGFKEFITRGNVIDLAVAVVIGTAFTAVVKALVEDLLTPIVAAIFGKQNFGQLTFTINGSQFHYGDFIDALITFLTIAAAVYFFVVVPVNALNERRKREPDPEADTRPCTECLSTIPMEAHRCAFCASPQEPLAA